MVDLCLEVQSRGLERVVVGEGEVQSEFTALAGKGQFGAREQIAIGWETYSVRCLVRAIDKNLPFVDIGFRNEGDHHARDG